MFMTMFSRSLVNPVSYSNVAGTSYSTVSMTVAMFTIMSRVLCMTNSFNNSFKTAVRTRFVFDYTVSSIGFFQGITSSKVIPMSVFMLRFVIVSMGIMYTIFEFVLSMTLKLMLLTFFGKTVKKTYMTTISAMMSSSDNANTGQNNNRKLKKITKIGIENKREVYFCFL